MKRRTFLKRSILAGGVAATFPTPRKVFAAEKKQRWRLALAVPKTLPIWGVGIERFANLVEQLTEGSLSIKVYGAGELIPALGTFEAVRKGEIQAGHAACYYWQGKIPASPFFTSVPFGPNVVGTISWIRAGGGQALYDEMMRDFGVLCRVCGATTFQMMGWFNREIKTISDLKGLKIRVPGLASEVYSTLGATPVLIPGGEVFTSLSTGVIDAVEWVGPYHDYLLGLHRAAKFYYGSSWHEPGAVLELMMNLDAWNKLSDHQQQAIEVATADTTDWMIAEFAQQNGLYLQKLMAETDVTIQPLPDSVLSELQKASEDVKSRVGKSSPLAERIYNSLSEFQKRYEEFYRLAGGYYARKLS
ncbi:MAG: TRAP transporter substrate-binding protein [Bdellovibrionales bacterium]|nr:TRAP transporter substrate-binding protein [Bdellovibrionales bacterium]